MASPSGRGFEAEAKETRVRSKPKREASKGTLGGDQGGGNEGVIAPESSGIQGSLLNLEELWTAVRVEGEG